MQLMVTGRHVDITEPLRTHIEKKIQKIKAYFDRIIEMRVVLSIEKYRQFAEITVVGNDSLHFHSKESTEDMYVSIDKALEKIERQLRRRIKVRQSKRKKAAAEPEVAEEETAEEGAGETPEDELVEQYGVYSVTVSDRFPAKPMSVEDALMLLDDSGDDFFAFINQQTEELNLVFRKRKGGYGLLRRR
jgi:putative sigma-54 modulation protein